MNQRWSRYRLPHTRCRKHCLPDSGVSLASSGWPWSSASTVVLTVLGETGGCTHLRLVGHVATGGLVYLCDCFLACDRRMLLASRAGVRGRCREGSLHLGTFAALPLSPGHVGLP